MTGVLVMPKKEEDNKLNVRELRCDQDFLTGVVRGLEARRKGNLVSWDKVKAELEIL